jgi:Domain of unknown function (DUF4114)/PEP-CTERM motif
MSNFLHRPITSETPRAWSIAAEGSKGEEEMTARKHRWVIEATAAVALSVAGVQAQASCTFGSSAEPSLQSALNGWLGAGAVNAQSGCLADTTESAWTTTTGGATILLELAGNASTNSFGLYDLSNPANRLSIFSGSDTAGADAVIQLTVVNGTDWLVTVQGSSGPSTSITLHQAAFGFYLGTAQYGSFYSETSRNTDGMDHMYAYAGTNTPFLSGPLAPSVFSTGDYILAWEDLPASNSDRDYQDFVVDVMNVSPVPLPSALWLLGSGLVGFFGVSRRKLTG